MVRTEMAGEDSCKGLMSFPHHWKEEEGRKATISDGATPASIQPAPNYSDKYSTFSKKALAPPDVPLVFI